MIPLYEKYKERGFTVVGVARESKREDMERALARDGYPWLNLLELQDEHKIWEKYGVSRAGGITVLVDRDGNYALRNDLRDHSKMVSTLKEELKK